MKYKWVCNLCGAEGREFLSRHKAFRGAKGHIKRTGETMNMTMLRVDGKTQIEIGGYFGELSRKIPA